MRLRSDVMIRSAALVAYRLALVACFAAGVAGLAWLALALLHPRRVRHPRPDPHPRLRVLHRLPCGYAAIMRSLGAAPHPLPGERSLSRQAMTVALFLRTTGPSSRIRPTGSHQARILSVLASSARSSPQTAIRSSELRAPILDGQHSNLYAFTQQANNVTIRYLTIQNFGAPETTTVRASSTMTQGPGWHIDHVTVQDNAGAGVMLGSSNVLAYSCLKDNGEYGFQGGGSHITVDHNEIVGNNTDNWEARQPGCGCTGGAKFWGVNGATITSNYVHDNLGPGLWADTNNRGFDVEHNYFADNEGEGFIYEISYNLRLADNTFVRNALVAGPNLGGFPDSAVYISESGADSRVPGPYGDTLAITGNMFTDNWGGVVLWENADRYCGSPPTPRPATARWSTLVTTTRASAAT